VPSSYATPVSRVRGQVFLRRRSILQQLHHAHSLSTEPQISGPCYKSSEERGDGRRSKPRAESPTTLRHDSRGFRYIIEPGVTFLIRGAPPHREVFPAVASSFMCCSHVPIVNLSTAARYYKEVPK
jgi:hypothetical protein